jgi:hypothetical protein
VLSLVDTVLYGIIGLVVVIGLVGFMVAVFKDDK